VGVTGKAAPSEARRPEVEARRAESGLSFGGGGSQPLPTSSEVLGLESAVSSRSEVRG